MTVDGNILSTRIWLFSNIYYIYSSMYYIIEYLGFTHLEQLFIFKE